MSCDPPRHSPSAFTVLLSTDIPVADLRVPLLLGLPSTSGDPPCLLCNVFLTQNLLLPIPFLLLWALHPLWVLKSHSLGETLKHRIKIFLFFFFFSHFNVISCPQAQNLILRIVLGFFLHTMARGQEGLALLLS